MNAGGSVCDVTARPLLEKATNAAVNVYGRKRKTDERRALERGVLAFAAFQPPFGLEFQYPLHKMVAQSSAFSAFSSRTHSPPLLIRAVTRAFLLHTESIVRPRRHGVKERGARTRHCQLHPSWTHRRSPPPQPPQRVPPRPTWRRTWSAPGFIAWRSCSKVWSSSGPTGNHPPPAPSPLSSSHRFPQTALPRQVCQVVDLRDTGVVCGQERLLPDPPSPSRACGH